MPDIEIDKLVLNKKISIRSSNACKGIGLNMLSEVISYFQEHKHFYKIQNCGAKSNDELVRLCEYHIEEGTLELPIQNIPIDLEEIIAESNATKFEELSSYKKAIFKQKLNFCILTLSNRARNGLVNYFNDLNSDEEIKKIISNATNFWSIRNIGEKSISELDELRVKLIKLLEDLSNTPDVINDVNLSEEFINTVLLKLPLQQDDYSAYLSDNEKLKLFKFLKYYTSSTGFLKSKENTAFTYLFTKDPIVDLSNDEVAELLGCTKERFRQVKVRVEKRMKDYFGFLERINTNEIVDYGLDTNANLITIDNNLCEKINEGEGTNFNNIFFNYIFDIFLSPFYVGFGHQLDFYRNNNRHQFSSFKSYYFISKSFIDVFNFDLFFIDFEELVTTSRGNSELINLRTFVIQYFKEGKSIEIAGLLEIIKSILSKEFDVIFSIDDNAVLEPNKKKKVHEYYYAIIENNDNPMKVSEIVSIANKLYPFLHSTEDSTRGILGKEKEKFIYFGRTSTYGLRIWEEQKDGIKGGTIKNLVEEYLKSQDGPRRITDILNYVNLYRKTNEKNVITNLKIDNTGTFIFYKGEVVGLASKHNDSIQYKLLEPRKTWLERYNCLVQFKIQNGNKLPSAISKDYKERTAYNLLYKSRKSYLNGTLGKEKENLISSLGYDLYIK